MARKRKKGFTLIELIVAVAIIAIVFPVISSVFLFSMNQTKDEDIKLSTMTDVQTILQKLKAQSKYGIGQLFQDYKVKYINGDSTKIVTTMRIATMYDQVGDLFAPRSGVVNSGFLSFKQPMDIDLTYQTQYENLLNALITINIDNTDTQRMIATGRYDCEIDVVPMQDQTYYSVYRVNVTVKDTQNDNKASTGYEMIGGD